MPFQHLFAKNILPQKNKFIFQVNDYCTSNFNSHLLQYSLPRAKCSYFVGNSTFLQYIQLVFLGNAIMDWGIAFEVSKL